MNTINFWNTAKRPEYLVVLVFSVMLFIYGGFNTLALFDLGVTVDPEWGVSVQAAAGIAYVTTGLVTIIGFILKSRNTILQGSLAMFCCFLFASILRILTYGLEPLGWLIFLFIAFAVGVCRYHIETSRT